MSLLDMFDDSAYPDPVTGPTRDHLENNSADAQAAQAWRALAPLIAAQPQVWISKDSGQTRRGQFLRRNVRRLTDALPKSPAAVPLYNTGGTTRTLVIDLDTARTSQAGVDRDMATLQTLVNTAGGRLITDHSPTGGRHAYLPLQNPVAFHDARDIAQALAARLPSMDTSPNRNLVAGLIRPPGAAHRLGGHQTLDGTLSAAHLVAMQRNPAAVWNALTAALSTELLAIRQQNNPVNGSADDHIFRRGGPREITARYAHIARTGEYETTRYRSPSEARQAVITSAAAAGMTLKDVALRIHTGTWPGLAALYRRYRPNQRPQSLAQDWKRAIQYIKKHPSEPPRPCQPDKSHTSKHPHTGAVTGAAKSPGRNSPAEYQFLREWWASLQLTEKQRFPGRSGPGRRLILRALGQAGMCLGSRYIAWGTRSLAVATGLDHSTVADHLRALREQDNAFVNLIEDERGLDGDLYELTIPNDSVQEATRRPWKPGKIHALRPVFRELGRPAAFVYEALEHAQGRRTGTMELARTVGMDDATVSSALETLAAFNLASHNAAGWEIVLTTNLTHLAEQLDVDDTVSAQLARYAVERQAYRVLYTCRTHHYAETVVEDHSWTWPTAPPDLETLADYVSRS